MPNESRLPLPSDPRIAELMTPDTVPLADWDPNSFQPVTIRDVGNMRYIMGEPEYVGRMPIRTELEVLPLPPDRDSQDDFTRFTNLAPPREDDFGGHALQVVGTPEPGQVLVANSWGSEWGVAPNFDGNQPGLQATPSGGMLVMNGSHFNHDIIFHTKDGIESLRIGDNGDFFVQGRLVKNDLEIYDAFKRFLGLAMGMPVIPRPREGIPTRYQRILREHSEGQYTPK